MKLTVEFVGSIDSGSYEKQHQFEVEAGTTVESFLAGLHFNKAHLSFIQVVRNGKRTPHSAVLKSGDRLELMLMVGGG